MAALFSTLQTSANRDNCLLNLCQSSVHAFISAPHIRTFIISELMFGSHIFERLYHTSDSSHPGSLDTSGHRIPKLQPARREKHRIKSSCPIPALITTLFRPPASPLTRVIRRGNSGCRNHHIAFLITAGHSHHKRKVL